MKRLGLLFTLSLLACSSGSGSQIAMTDNAGTLEVSVAASRLIMSLPSGGLRQMPSNVGGATANPRYFYFANRSSGTILSGWFEPAQRYVALDPSLAKETEGLRKAGFTGPQDVQATTIGAMNAVVYRIPTPSGSSSHVRASYVGSGTWVDLHASVTSGAGPDETRRQVVELVKSISFREKP
jgi:hypothetical protein